MCADRNGNPPRYRRILLKLSGEALAGERGRGLDPQILEVMCSEIAEVREAGVQLAVVVGAGNFFRGASGENLGISRVTGDHMGMLATVMNSLALADSLEKKGCPAAVMTSVEMKAFAEPYAIGTALSRLEQGSVVIAAGGTGHPFFTTDTAAGLRAVELGADIMLKATRVDGVYTGDPEKDPSAQKIEKISYQRIIEEKLRVLDLTCVSLCMENSLPIMVFNLFEKGALVRAARGEKTGTIIS